MTLFKAPHKLSLSLKCFCITISCLIFPVNAASNFSFAEFNIAFLLGLILPVIIIALGLKKSLTVKWRYPALACFFILLQLYAFEHFTQWQNQIVLICAAAYLSSLFYWYIHYENSQQSANRITKFFSIVVGISLSILLLSSLLFHQVNVYFLWLIFVLIVVSCALFNIVSTSFRDKLALLTGGLLWVSLSLYSAFIYLWLNTQIELPWLITMTVVSFVAVIVASSRQILAQINQLLITGEYNSANQNLQLCQGMTPLDPVTNLPTHQQGLSQLRIAMNNTPDAKFVAIVFKPINFHEVNKVLGHQNSDILLLQLAYNLQQCASEEPTLLNFNFGEPRLKVARLQGLDFLVVLECSTSIHPEELFVDTICRNLVNAVPQAMSFKSFSLNFELAFGAAISGEHGESAEQLIAHASDALLDAEREQQMLSYFDYKTAIYSEKQLTKMEQLKSDVINEQLTWLAHSQVSLVNNRLLGFKLSVSWPKLLGNDPSELQHEVFQLAEYSGEIHRLTKQYIKHAILMLASSHENDFHVEVSINLSAQALFEPDLANLILVELEQANVLPKYLVIEIDEALFVSHLRATKAAIDQLQANGFSVAINQFSGSFEALRYLRKVAINRIQIDASQLDNSRDLHADKAIIDALINVARKMDLPVIATGINNQSIAESYLSIGGDFAQGKKVAAPIEIKDVKAWLIAWARQNS